MSLVSEGRSVFMRLTVMENLRVANVSLNDCLEMFPELAQRKDVVAGRLSGGEQQMLAIARALGRSPRLLLVDELSLGLAPLIVKRLMTVIRDAADHRDLGVLLVEQHVVQALDVADRIMVLQRGRLVLSGNAIDYRGRMDDLQDAYLSEAPLSS
jgi:branched-chain amino acid transport system ATP-binding protein